MLQKIFLFTLLVGLGLLFYSFTLPYYTDPVAKHELDNWASQNYDTPHFKDSYYKQLDILETNKRSFMDVGTGIAIASFVLLLFFIFQRVKTFSDLRHVRSLPKIALLILSPLIWALLIPGMYLYYDFRLQRGDYPAFADTIIIGIYRDVVIILIGLFFMLLFVFVTSIKGTFKVPIFYRPLVYNKKAIIWEIFWSFWLLVNLLSFISFVIDGDHISIAVNLFFTYVLLCLRAAQLTPRQTTITESRHDMVQRFSFISL